MQQNKQNHRTKPIFEFELEFDKNNPYMKFGRNLIKIVELRETTDRWIDRQRDRQAKNRAQPTNVVRALII